MDKGSISDESRQGVCLITPENLSAFASFLLPGAMVLIEAGEPVTAFGYVDNGTACAAVCGFIEASSFEIISFYVAPDYRKKHIATELMSYLKDMVEPYADTIGINFFITADEHGLLSVMLERYGFKRIVENNRSFYATTLGKLLDSKLYNRDYGESLFPSFSETDKKVLSEAERLAGVQDLPLPEGGFMGPAVDMKCSTIHLRRDGIKSYVAIEKNNDGSLLVSGVANCTGAPMEIMKAIHDSVDRAADIYPENTLVLMQTVNEEAKKLLELVDDTAASIDRRYEFIIRKTV